MYVSINGLFYKILFQYNFEDIHRKVFLIRTRMSYRGGHARSVPLLLCKCRIKGSYETGKLCGKNYST